MTPRTRALTRKSTARQERCMDPPAPPARRLWPRARWVDSTLTGPNRAATSATTSRRSPGRHWVGALALRVMAPCATCAWKPEGLPGLRASGRLPVASGSPEGRLEYWAGGTGIPSPGSALAPMDHNPSASVPLANANRNVAQVRVLVFIRAPCGEPPLIERVGSNPCNGIRLFLAGDPAAAFDCRAC